jgi:hypothetical protein
MLRFHTYPRRLYIRAAVSECESAAGATASRTFAAFEIRRQLSRRHVSRGLSDSDWSITFGFDLLLADRLPSYRVNGELMFKRETINLLAILAIALTFFFCFRIVWNKFDKTSKRPVDERTAALMPVVAVSGGKISLFLYRGLADYIQSTSGYTFLIPEDQEERLRWEIQRQPKEQGVDASWTFEVEQRSQGKQRIRVSVSGDRLLEGWYEATDKTITSLYEKCIGAGDAIWAGYLAAAMTGIICLVFFASFTLYQRWLKKTDGQSFTT